MITALPQFHHDVEEGGHGRGSALRQEREVPLENGSVVLLLDDGQLYLHDRLLLGRQALLNVLLQSTKHHRLQNLQRNSTTIKRSFHVIISDIHTG